MLLKSQTVNLLYSNDNYLQIYTNLELYRFRNFSAYLKLLFVIKRNIQRRFILKSYFLKFAEIIEDYIPIKTLSLKRCFMRRINNGEYFHNGFRKRFFQLWRQLTQIFKPTYVNMQFIYSSLLIKIKDYSGHCFSLSS
jgi:hypothetical protein